MTSFEAMPGLSDQKGEMEMPEKPQARTSPPSPGVILRRIRSQRGWTLADVARRCGMPVSTLSKVENGKTSLTYDKLSRISEALEIDIAALFSRGTEPSGGNSPVGGRRSITRAGEGQQVETEQYSHLYPATEFLNKGFTPIIAEVKCRTIEEFGELIYHDGEEFAYILEGVVVLHTDLFAPTVLNKGDCIHFDSSMGHAYLAGTAGRCVVMSICSAIRGGGQASSSGPSSVKL